MIQYHATVVGNEKLGADIYRLTLACHPDYRFAVPGQFVMLQLPRRLSPLLRRPFSIHRLIKKDNEIQGIEILYKVVGKATRTMTGLRASETVDLVGPLGRGFTLTEPGSRVFIVAGGIGVAPLVFLAEELLEGGAAATDITVFFGGRTDEDLCCVEDFQHLGIAVHLTTDDGSAGDQCLVTDPMTRTVEAHRPDIIYACGPSAMLDCVAGVALLHGIGCEISIESRMACGIGACLGCAVENRKNPDRFSPCMPAWTGV